MLADVGMVKTYSKSAHVNDLGFVWTSPPCYYVFFRQVVLPYLAGTHCTIFTSALVFGGNIVTHP